jgi:predicted amidohydrolase YtcJ
VTTVQDASITNDPARWELFHGLAASGNLGVRLCMLPGFDSLQAFGQARPATARVLRGAAKIMLSERSLDLDALVAQIDGTHRAGFPVAIHAVSAAELAVALLALREATPNVSGSPDRIEHGATIPDQWLPALRATGVTVVGQPGLVHDRGDQYLRDFEPEQHGWLHRARSLLAAGVPYAVGSDAPVTEPSPSLMLHAMRTRQTRDGVVLGAPEALGAGEALHALTTAPALAAGITDLGVLRPGALADLVVIERGALDAISPAPRETRLTMLAGEIVWRTGV